MHEYLRWKPKPVIPPEEMPIYSEETALWIYRNKGDVEYKNYLAQFDPPEEEVNLPKWIIFRCEEELHEGHEFCCPMLIESIKACSYDKPGTDGKPMEDVAEFAGDDPYDNARYLLDSAERYFEEAAEEFKKIQQQAEIVSRLGATGDMTAFYRQMRSVESVDVQQMVRRFHKVRR
jgi:hypothetical protein